MWELARGRVSYVCRLAGCCGAFASSPGTTTGGRTPASRCDTSNRGSRRRLALIGAPQAVDGELDHSNHRPHRALGAGLVGPADILSPSGRHDLPRYAVAILEPAALVGLTAIGKQGIPEPIDLGLVGAIDHERNGVGKIESLAAVQRHEPLAGQGELHHQHRTCLAGRGVDSVALDRL